MKRAFFLDRDGVINRNAAEGDYILRWEDVEILPDVSEAIAIIKRAGFDTVIVTNQRCVAKGLISEAELESIHARMREELARAGAAIDAIYYCPHEAEPPCRCRKPKIGMLLDAAHDRGIDLSASWMVGDSQKDIEAGAEAGCSTVHIAGGGKKSSRKANLTAANLLEAVKKILT